MIRQILHYNQKPKNLEITETAMPRSSFDKINSGHINQFLNSQFTIFVLVKFTIYNSELSVLYTSSVSLNHINPGFSFKKFNATSGCVVFN